MVQADGVTVVVDGTVLLPPTTLRLSPGTALMVRGHNGAGKSTFLRVLSGLRTPTSGSVSIAGEPVSKRNRTFRRRVAAMIGMPPMASDLTVRDHVELIGRTWFDGTSGTSTRTDELLEALAIGALGRRFPHELSTGQLQLAGLAMVLARPADVLLLDEPEQRLDAERVGFVADVLCVRREAGATLIVATHSPVLASRVGQQEIDLGLAR
jgi:ABC-type multidrug transport system ATPase subunit